ncbi:hypothetical protein FSARC_4151 [Fusarium sarcochroum]|uniref:Uncharacterized protein n=1 Tax=Fusarium sarcochroum TaxID=1208366 RepID=A0A8H4U2H2_9HYPO|nr:hypothetical protein FSARC_4151 [Fusarium sarcochroum]
MPSVRYFALAFLAVLGTSNADATVEMFSDGDCQNSLGTIDVWEATCASPSPGFSSMKVTGGTTRGIITAYTQNNCGCPTCGSHGYNPGTQCLKDFGFVANAIGLS